MWSGVGISETLEVPGQLRINDRVWRTGDFVGDYANTKLNPVESILFERYRDSLSRRTLELGCGAGRLTGHLIDLGGDVVGTDVNQAMLEYCRRTYPGGTFELLDIRNVRSLEAKPFDVVLAGANLIDVLDDAERLRMLRSLADLLVPNGLVILSSHNRAFVPSVPGPLRAALRGGTLSDARRLLWWAANRLRLRRHLRDEDDYAIVNDEAHDFRLLHYYISRDAQERQFEAAAFTLVECLDLDGRLVERGEMAEQSSSLHYVARRR
jgi:SAM-dependent methyltransferase